MNNVPKDYLKYYRVIRQYYKVMYGLPQADLDVLLFLYSERQFDRDKFQEYNSLLSWDVRRFEKLMKRGWIEVLRVKSGNRRTIYELSFKAKRLIDSLYKKLNGEEIPVSVKQNNMFAKKVSYTDKVYRNMIMEMNEAIRQRRHRAQE